MSTTPLWAALDGAAIMGIVLVVWPEKNPQHNPDNIRCFNGVQYYMIREYQKGFMAPVYDKDTKQVKLCSDRYK